jgi:hypothetical protein
LKEGMLVWSLDSNTHKIAVPVLRTSAIPVSPGHRMIHLMLKDGRQLWASPGHPTSDGRTVIQLEKDAIYDGGAVELKESVAYGAQRHMICFRLVRRASTGRTGFCWRVRCDRAKKMPHQDSK